MRRSDKTFLKKHPLCASCMRAGKYRKATTVWTMTNGTKESRCDDCAKGRILKKVGD